MHIARRIGKRAPGTFATTTNRGIDMRNNTSELTDGDLRLFEDISTSIHAVKDFDEMLHLILYRIKMAFQVDGASIALHEPDQKEFFFIRTIEMEKHGRDADIEKMRFPDHRGIAGWVLRNNQTAVIPDTTEDERVLSFSDARDSDQIKSMICVPLRSQAGPIGVLYIVNKRKGTFPPKDTRLLEILSVTIAITIENSRLCGKLENYARFLEKENLRLKSEVQNRYERHGIIGSSTAMRRLYELIDKVIDAGITVLIQGETGTGKELVAKVIHYGGRYKDQPFISENCGALTDSLLESELFGHVKGAFTGAISDKKGLFELADGGAVMLDEIGEMPPNMQVKMLRVLQENEFRPVGGSVYKKVNVRIIACTNRNLEEEVEKGKFRQDLYYRINVFPINIPPLRKRREDIPLLANHFLEFFSEKYNRPKPILTADALDRLMGYDWPGNVRELQNEIERALTLARPDEDISAEHLSTSLRNAVNNGIIDEDLHLTLPETVTRVEKQMISRELEKAKMNRTHAARALGITRQGLLKKIKRYNLSF